MSYFKNGIAYIEIPDADITEEMVNNTKRDFNADASTLTHTNVAATIQRTIFKAKTPISPVFNGYMWNNLGDILIVKAHADYADPEITDG